MVALGVLDLTRGISRLEPPAGLERQVLIAQHHGARLEPAVNPLQEASFSTSSEADWAAAGAALTQATPPEHMAFLNNLERYLILGGYAFVHAGVEVTKTLEEQSDADLYWSRERWLAARRRFSHKVVHGHTPTEQPHHDERRVGVDESSFHTGVRDAG